MTELEKQYTHYIKDAPDAGDMQQSISRLRKLSSEIEGVCESVRNTADQMFGRRPEPCGSDECQPCAEGQVNELGSLIDNLFEEVGSLRDQVERLARL